MGGGMRLGIPRFAAPPQITAITSNVLRRTFYIKSGDKAGAAFAVEVSDKQLLVTAKHIFEGNPSDHVFIHYKKQWSRLGCKVIFARHGIDIAVIDLGREIAPRLPIKWEEGKKRAYLGQDVFLAGFPLNFYTEAGQLNNDFPIPMVAKGCIAAFQNDRDSEQGICGRGGRHARGHPGVGRLNPL
jgi:hypothetical protein